MRRWAVAAAAIATLATSASAQDGAWTDFMPPARRGATLVHDTTRDRYVLFGGGDLAIKNEVWSLPADSTTWRQLAPLGRAPVPRSGSASVYDPLHDRIWVFGGISATGVLSGLWGLDADPEEWLQLATGPGPTARGNAALVRDAVRDRLILYGGELSPTSPGTGASGEVWWIAPYADTVKWTKITAAGAAPAPRWGAIAAYDAARNKLVVLGGRNRDSVFTDAWELTLAPAPVWKQLLTNAGGPPPRDGALGMLDAAHDRIVTFGGADPATGVPNSDVWAFKLGTLAADWTLLPATGEPPDCLLEACAAVDSARGVVVIHGGGRPQALNASYASNRTRGLSLGDVPAWLELAPPGPAPQPRYGTGTALDPVHDALFVFGGLTSLLGVTAYSNELWRMDLASPGTWTRASYGPPARHEPAFAFDSAGNRLVLFGGWNGNGYLGDTWLASAQAPFGWTALDLPVRPQPRRALASAWDPARRALFVFGGQDADSAFGDAWELDLAGTPAWRRIDAAGAAPSPRAWASAVYDAPHDRMIVYGGSVGGVSQEETWALWLAGTPRWEQLAPVGAGPGPRTRHAAVYDGARGRMLVWGGFDSDNTLVSSTPGVWALALDGTPTWTKLMTVGLEPYPATAPSVVLDARRARLVTYGGSALFDDLLPDVHALAFGGAAAAWILSARIESDGVHLAWQTTAAPGSAVFVQKRVDAPGDGLPLPFEPVGTWFTIAAPRVAVDGTAAWRDPHVGGGGAYAYRLVVGDEIAGEIAITLPVVPAFALLGVAPSPTRGPLTLQLRSTGQAPVSLALFDALGRRVLTRDLGMVPAGPQSLAFDLPAGRRAGVYFLRVAQGASQATRKIVVF